MKELKPCPFCGNKDLHLFSPTPFGTPAVWWASISCNCGIELSISTKDENEIIDKWNERIKQ